MNKEEILLAYRSGKLTIAEAKQKLNELRNQNLKRPLSEGQKGLWMLQKTSPNMSAYNVPICFRVGRILELDKFQQACCLLLEQHPILQTVIGEDQGVPYQIIQPAQPLFFEIEDVSNLDSEEVLLNIRKKVKMPFRLEQGPLMRVHLFIHSNDEEEPIVLINIHHIIFDGSSFLVFVTKLLTIYQDLLQNKAPEIIASSTSYNDFVEWEQAMLTSKAGEEHLAYWKQQLSGALPVLELPTDHPRSSVPSFEGQVHTKLLSPELAGQIKAFSDSLQINCSVMFLGLFKVLIQRYTNQAELIIGLPTFGRSQERFSSLIGYFINMIPIRSQVVGSRPFSDYVRELQLTLVDGLDHAEYPFPALVRALNVPRIQGIAPVFQVIFLYQNFIQANSREDASSQEDDSRARNRLTFAFMEEIHQEGEYELELEVFEQRDTFKLNFKYDPQLFEEETIARMVEHYLNLTSEVMRDPNIALDSYSFLSKTETQKLLIDWNATEIDYPKEKCVHQLFEDQAQKTPDAIAVIFEDETLTYRELDQKSTQLAIYLQKQGVKPDSLVGICVDRHWEMLVGLLGILKAGGAYVPLDPDYPVERLEYMLEDSKLSILLTQARLMGKISRLLKKNLKVISLDKDWANIQAEIKTRKLKQEVNCEHLAYVIYTSGSTGKPKGVMIPHHALTNFLTSMSREPGLSFQDKMLAVTTFCFDIAGLELYLPLINGAKVCICSSAKAKDVEKLKQEIHKCQPTLMQATPVTWTMLFRTGWRNEERIKILCGGEALSETLKQSFMDNHCEVWNMFGPTETTIWSTIEPITKEKPITLGKPIANTRIYIVDRNFKPTPIGIPGELCIAGDGLASGYLNQSELTAEKFVPNPFFSGAHVETHGRASLHAPPQRIYRTGDLARWTNDGKIEFLGRMDHQVKVRGFRIELGEIESQLSTHPDIQDCAVIVKEQEDHKQLLAFYIAQKPLSYKQLRAHLSLKLPEYMIPSSFILLDKMPLTPNGKHDRKALGKLPDAGQGTDPLGAGPHFEIEAKVLGIWKEVIQRNDIGLDEGFFDVGGDSYLAVTVAGRINEDFNCSFSVTELFRYANIRDISKYIADAEKVVQSVAQENIKPPARAQITGHQRMIDTKSHNSSSYPDYYEDSIAIIGFSCQFPGAKNYLEFWDNLRAGKESVKFFSKEELAGLNLPKEVIENPYFVPIQATIEDKDLFDPGFFNISPKDAELMDPQFRLLLLHSWKAVEDAGYVAKQIPETSVYMSASNSFYQALNLNSSAKVLENSDGYVSWLLAQSGAIPTMISHKLGLKGPSYAVHSNCSSSLVGLYSAYQSLRSGKTKYALVGAATIHPQATFGYVHQPGLNFSSDGHLKAFDAAADGMIGGEGAAVVVLKKATDAIADGDHIYALLRGIDVNNDGADKVGYYAPSVKGQAEVIRNVIEETRINPESVSYIEAHGTGTKLGDPIEFTALCDIYQQYTTKLQFCGIGSVKTNIGHLDTAAGLAGCIKVALSLYHKEIPPSINYKEPNPNIDFNNSPFYVVDKLRQWERADSGAHTAVPNRAALSSFGIGGTNTHAIFEEYETVEESAQTKLRPDNNNISYLIPLSARNKERLKVYAQRLHEFLQKLESNVDLADLAYTFQVGREEMESRVIVIANNINELSLKLAEFVKENEKVEGCFWGEVKQTNDIIQLYEKDEEHQEIIHKWIAGGKLEKLAGLWVKGLHLDWELLNADRAHKPRRISLPTYPFAEEHYWIPDGDNVGTYGRASLHAPIHPLLHQNTSNLYEQRFSSTFTGREFFLEDHVIQGRRILPGVAYLEMARAAVEASLSATMTPVTGAPGDSGIGMRLKNVVWLRPIAVGEKLVQVHIGLYPEDGVFSKDSAFEEDSAFFKGEIAYEIYSEPEEAGTEPKRVRARIIHSRGIAVLGPVTKVQTLDLPALQSKCTQSTLTAEQCYEAFRSMGTEYGPGHQGVEALYIGAGQVLAKLVLPSVVVATGEQFVLHPSLMDAALQAPIGLVMGPDGLKPGLPFVLQELEIIGNCTATMWAWIRYSEGSKAGDKVEKLDIDLCDDHGNVCARLKGYSSRAPEGEPQSLESLTNPQTLMFEPVWRESAHARPNIPLDARASVAPDSTGHLVIFCEPGKDFAESIETRARAEMTGVRCLILQSKQKGIGKRFQIYAIRIFEEIRQIFESKPTGKVLLQVVVPFISEQQLFCGLSGLLKTAALENPKFIGQLISVDSRQGALVDAEEILAILKENARMSADLPPTEREIRYQDGKIWVVGWREVEAIRETLDIPWKERGTYLITGGVGGLGLIFTGEIVNKVKDVTLILTGRSMLDESKQAQLKELEDRGARIIYKQVNVTQRAAVIGLIQNIREEFGGLNGIIHSAGVIQDNFILKKTTQEFQDVLAPKVTGLVNLDDASRDLPLDFFIVFSSVSSLGSLGQADYSTANAFMDAYAKYRNTLVASGQRQGQTLSINWPLWQEGGMRADAGAETMMRQNTGVAVMETKVGIRAFYHCLAFKKDRVLVMHGDAAQIRRNMELDSIPREVEVREPKEILSLSGDSLKAETLKFLRNTLAKTIKLPPEKIQPGTPFEKYGLDSILQITVINELEKITGELSKTLLFEYNSTQELADYLLKNHAGQLMASFGKKSSADLTPTVFDSPAIPELESVTNRKPRFMKLRDMDRNRIKEEAEDIAIIGVSGRYPLSNTLEELWEHLKAGDNCITEAPKDRWSASLVQTLSGNEMQQTEERYYGGFLEDSNRFDHYLFGITKEEVWGLSPEIRLFLEIVWETFEDAGYTRLALQELQTRYKKGIGVFVGAMYNLYPFSIPSLEQAVLSANATDWHIANRASHFFDLTGPSIAVNSACSSSLTAIHLACESLKQQNCSMAIAGGVNLTLDPSKYDMLQQTGFLGSGHISKSFGTGDGYIPGEGVGAVLLKPLSMALKDHDRILAVVRSSFVNHSGGRQLYSAPDPKQQAQLIIDSIQSAGIAPETIGYVESAANGSELGDPIEVIALKNAFGQYTSKKQFCALGSVKSNLGHLEAASGISQLSKVILQLKHHTLVPTINANPRNPNIKLENTAFYLQEEIRPWSQFKDPKTGESLPRRSMINSFGAGGSFANLIVEEFDSADPIQISDSWRVPEYLIVFSAKTAWSLIKYAASLKTYLEQNPKTALGDIELRLQKINHNLEHRAAIIAISSADLLKKLDLLQEGRANLAAADIYLSCDAAFNEDLGETKESVLERKDLRRLAEYWTAGADIDFRQLYDNYDTPRIDLPKYAFDHNLEFSFSNYETLMDDEPRNDYARASVVVPEVYEYDETYLKDHTVYDERVLIGVTHGSLAINAFFKIFPQESNVHLHKLTFVKPVEVKKGERVEVLVEPLSDGPAIDFQVLYRYGTLAAWNLTATGNLHKTGSIDKQIDINSIKDSYQAIDFFNQNLAENPIVKEGESFRTNTQLYLGKDQILARVVLSRASREENHEYVLHPLIIHSAFQVIPFLLGETGFKEGSLPFGIKDIYFRKTDRLAECWVLVTLVKNSGEMIVFDAEVINDASEVVAKFIGCSSKRMRPITQIPKNEAQYEVQNADLVAFPVDFECRGQETAELLYTDTFTSAGDITAEIQKFLTRKLAKIAPDAARLENSEVNLMELGLTSAQLVAMAGEIEKETDIELYPTVFFEYPNLKELTEFFAKEHRDSFVKLKGVFKAVTVKQAAVADEYRSTIRSVPPQPLPKIIKTSPAIKPTTVSAKENSFKDDIAIIGVHGLFAEAQNLDQFWHNLAGKKDVIKEIPPDHWDYHPWYDANPGVKDRTYCKWGSFIDDVDKFDAGFFNISPREAEWMDPQLRLMLQSVYATGEDAGYINRLRGSNAGVFMGVCFYDYLSKISELNINPDLVYTGLNNSATSFASRISFLFDLKGPSNTVDTACSSSLTALHYACNALRNKECDMAFVGGANLLLASGHYRYFSSMGALSPTGRCHTFDEAADGYVPGECIASILLKPLQVAKKDGDRIYAIIKGSAALHGGYTPSFTAPSVAGEENVILKAWEDARINPETLGYIEAHGTGTKLGDPVEINSLKKAFQRFTKKEHFCAIGSVKANIGHAEGAAGIAGLLKVVTQMNHKQIPAMPQFQKLNPYIRIDESALYINEELQEWKSPAGVPRRAGVSSFGISGAYAHVVLEEYIPRESEQPQITVNSSNPAIIVLSAKNEDCLQEQARRLIVAIGEYQDKDLADLAYTLQIGREAMEERLALITGSVKELEEKLQSFLEGREDIPNLYRGHIKGNQETLAVFNADEDLQKSVESWISKGKYDKLLDLWVKGMVLDWNKVYGETYAHGCAQPRRIGLPTYPFARERYWVPGGSGGAGETHGRASQQPIHPLLHQNTSDLSEQRYSSTFTGWEFFLKDHVIMGRRVLPGVAYLEMARAAVKAAAGNQAEDKYAIKLENVIWARPIVVGEQPVEVYIGLHLEDVGSEGTAAFGEGIAFNEGGGRITYEIYSPGETDEDEALLARTVNSQGSARLVEVKENPVLDLKALQAECNRQKVSGNEIYNILKTMGFDYGAGHQGIETIYTGQGLVLAKLSLPSSVAGNAGEFVMHPSMMDAALQASIVMGVEEMDGGTTPKVYLPFALQELELYQRCQESMWAVIQYNVGNMATDKISKLDIDLCDEKGNVSVRMKGFSSRALEEEKSENVLATYDAIASGRNQVMALEGDIRKSQTAISKQAAVSDNARAYEATSSNRTSEGPVTAANPDQLSERASNYLKKLLAPVIKLPVERIEADAPLAKYGIDSIMAMQLTNQLEKTFGSLSKTLFFEYQTIRELSGYFLNNYREQLNQLIGVEKKEEVTKYTVASIFSGPIMPVSKTARPPRSRFTTLQPIQEGKTNKSMDIAIIGVSGRYPRARNLEEYWMNLRDGKDCITEIPKDRWDYSLYYDEDKNKPGKTYSKWGGFLDDVDKFDPLFFNISPMEAEFMDPQERLFLECVYETIEDAGYCRESLAKDQDSNIGVYVGVMYEEYQLFGAQAQVQGFPIAFSGNPSSIANRVSYFCNFYGPSVAVDTMCSSSLTAIHLACQSIQQGGCELAIAGGVNVSIHPNKYLMLGQGKFISSKGRCESFGKGGDGYVPGEGVGAVLLKPLSKAVADEDHIYGVIKGTAINHGGKTNGFSVPNPNAQARVIGQALQEAGIDPRTISYIEAHGTGTSLGDPIEITGLVKAFQKYTENRQFCAIGTAKSNIGHCESASGIAGVTKVLLQLKNRQIAPSLHSEVLNPNIDFLNTPFVVQQTLTEWKRPIVSIEGVTKEYPRIAGISAFGAGGSNAHIIIEEYNLESQEQTTITRADARVTPRQPALIILSAKDEERLKEQAERLIATIRESQFADNDLANGFLGDSRFLADMAYTLQVGREAMEERLGVITVSARELTEKLLAFLAGKSGIEDLYRGQVKRNQEAITVFTADEEMQEAIQKWIERKKYGKLLELWVKGLVFNWNTLYGDQKPHRISLPKYPFARERYWVPEIDFSGTPVGTRRGAYPQVGSIHPLLHQNTSDLSEQRYSSTFTGREFFLADHVVRNKKVFPGVAYLEMARAAVDVSWPAAMTKAAGNLTEDARGRVIKLKNVVWAQPIRVDEEPVQIHIGLYPEEGAISFEIYSVVEKGKTEETRERAVYCQGSATLSGNTENQGLDLKALQAKCNGRELSGTEVYNIYKAVGLDYGPGHRGLETIYTGQGLVLAKLSLPSSVAGTEKEFALHPSIMDGALQAAIGMGAGEPGTPGLFLPFALEELELFNRCTGSMWAVIQYSRDNTATDKVQKLDIDICDEQGNVCVRMQGFTSRAPEVGIGETGLDASVGSVMFEPVWKEQAVLYSDGQIEVPEYIQQLVILCEPAISPESIETGLKCVFAREVKVLSLKSKQKSIAKRYRTYAVQVFEALQKILTDKSAGKVLVQLVIASSSEMPSPVEMTSLSKLNSREEQKVFAGLSGILKTAQLENPKVIGQIIEVETMEDPDGLISKLKENARLGASNSPTDNQVRYQGDKRLVAGWSEVTVLPETATARARIPWKDGGVYLITGGAGGLGMIFAKEIAEQVKGAALILTGRSMPGEAKQLELKKLESLGTRVEYRPVDVCDQNAVYELIRSIGTEFGKLDGIIHSAGVIWDNYIIKKSKEEFVEVLAPKVIGLVNLDEASQNLGLDFMILFSSTSGSLGNPGQADYAAANAFMDAYAVYRNALVASGLRQGRTLSINWPLWQEGGMRVDERVEKMMQQSAGMVALRTGTGIQALYDGIVSGRTQVGVLEGDIRQIRAMFSKQSVPSESMNTNSSLAKPETMTVVAQDLLQEKTSNYLKKLLSPVIKLPVERIETDSPLEKYGINSVMVMQLTNQLEKTFGSLSKTLFFEYQTIRDLSGYFLESYREQLNQLIGIEKKEEVTKDTGTTIPSGPIMPFSRAVRPRRSRFTSLQPLQESKPNKALDIAIIGISGRYPQARNLQEFWQNLRDGKDCVTEIPKDRWDHSLYYDEDKNKRGKTYSKWGGFIEDVDKFDPLFFNISPREAEFMDPQERLFLECVYATIEDAGYTQETIAPRQDSEQGSETEGNVGVYVGVMYEEYQLYGAQAQIQGFPIALSENSSSIANRVSYFCNFHGPSVVVNTMCSSSLMAIYMACQSIQHGGCELAIAGGVNVSIHPNKYLALAQGKFASSKGRCESFGQGGDGYVPGEGVGAVLLKPLSKAITDGDQIYGVIKGAAINHGGKTNGYTVPNPNAQTRVIGQALQEAGIDPRTISYIEAHGTGTSLGDPIEITGLVKAFQKYTGNKQFCAIGSAKSNIGHCESAAGIAGVTKVLLQLKNRQIAPSLHSEVLNPNIDFLNTPFIVQQTLTEWKRPVVTIEGVTKEYPRIAGISAFGAGGSNAHIIIEEYNPESQEQTAITRAGTPVTPRQPALVILSAKDDERLKEQAERLIVAIGERQFSDADLADMAYTLQIGREAMAERLGVIASSTGELTEKLTAYLSGQNSIAEIYRGQVKRDQDALTVFTADEDLQNAVELWVNKGKYSKLLDLWTKGLVFDWNRLYGENKPRRISLPTYPFARERYWAPVVETYNNTSLQAPLHPLLHQNNSIFSEQRYSATFSGEEIFLADHIVNGRKILPGVAQLEMARAAVALAVGLETGRAGMRLKDIFWIRPVVVGEEHSRINIRLYQEDVGFKEAAAFTEGDGSEEAGGEIFYEIYGESKDEDGEPLVFSQGRAVLTEEYEGPVLDLKAVQAECRAKSLKAEEVYEAFRLMGIEYGPAYLGVVQIYVGNGQILAKLSLPAANDETQEQFVLHPSLMDAALQASIALETSFKDRYSLESRIAPTGVSLPGALKPMLPFALQELEVFGSCTPHMWALIRNSEGSRAGDKVRKIDVDVCDNQGKVCVRLKGFSSRVLEGENPTATGSQPITVENTPEFQAGTVMLIPSWETVSIKRVENFPALNARVVMVGGTKEQKVSVQKKYPNTDALEIQTRDSIDEITRKLTGHGTIDHILWIAPYQQLKSLVDETLIKGQSQGVLQVFKIIKALLKLGYGTRELGFSLITNRTQAVYKNDPVNPTYASLHGLVGSMAKEYPNWKIRLIDLESNKNWPVYDIFTLQPDPEGNPMAYRGEEWYQQRLIPVRSVPTGEMLYKSSGVYVVIGGAGGIGEAWSEYMIRTYQAQVVWIGRRAKNEAIQIKIDRLATLGPKPQYIAADATDRQALQQAYNEIKERHSRINGVIHAAIVLLDRSLANMTEEQFLAGLSAKVDVSVRLAQVFASEPLDFVLFFSSFQSFTKAAGQSNYASGCAFKDAFAHQLRREWPCAVKVMNWGYWGNMGIVASPDYQVRMAQAGIGSIEPPEAMEALEKLLAGPVDQIALIKMTKPLTMEGINPENPIEIYPEDLPSAIGDIQNYLIVPDFDEDIQSNGG